MEIKATQAKKDSFIRSFLEKYRIRQGILLLVDIFSVLVAFLIGLNLTGISGPIGIRDIIVPLGVYITLNTISFYIFGCYTSLWRYAGEQEIISVVKASVVYIIPLYFLNKWFGYEYSRLFYIVNTLFIIILTEGSRLAYRTGRRIKCQPLNKLSKVLIVGAGSAGELVLNELNRNPELGKIAIGFVDDDKNKIGRNIHGVRILGSTKNIKDIVENYDIDEIILAMINVTSENKRRIIDICNDTKCKLRTIPGIFELIDGTVDIKKIRDVKIEDLLGRETLNGNLDNIAKYIENKVVMVTGAGGSIGSELCRQIAKYNPKMLIILDNYENNAYAIQQELKWQHKSLDIKTIIASIREKTRMESIFQEYLPEVVFHAAAHKHVPLMEDSPGEAIKNNIFGTLNVAQLADRYKTKRFVLISTDKAVNPTNIMGATKRACEMIIQAIDQVSETEYVAVRFGNVLGSNGSVIPLFKKQILEGGPVTVTHPEITRFFMTIPEAVALVIEAGGMARGGEIFVLDMGEPMKILDLAKNLIRLSGFEPDVDIKIEFTGLRPGEKLYEELLMNEEGLTNTENNKIFVARPMDIDRDCVKRHLMFLDMIIRNEEIDLIDNAMKAFVSTYIRPEEANLSDAASL